MEPRELYNALKGKSEVDYELSKERWEQARMISWNAVWIHLGKKSKIKSPLDIMAFPWDKKIVSRTLSEEEKREIIRQSNKALGIKR